MKKWLPTIGVIFLVVGLSILGYQFRDRFQKKPAGLEVNTSPKASVYLNDKLVGETPYSNKSLAPGSYTVKIVPEAGSDAPSPWETRLVLSSFVTTVINHSFAPAETDSSGSVLQLTKEPGGKTYLSLISDPDTINVTVDGKPHGFTPLTKIDAAPGSHTILASSPGYKSQNLTVNTVKGYNLVVNIKLAVDQITLAPAPTSSPSSTLATPTASASASPSPSPWVSLPKPYVVVKDTSTGWLRVRKEPSATADELGKANVGEKLKYLGESTETGWHKIEFEKLTGWVSGKYVDLVK